VFSRVGRFPRSQGKIGKGKVGQNEIAVDVKRLLQGNPGLFDLLLFFENGGEQVVQPGIAFICRNGLFAKAAGFIELPLIRQDPREEKTGFLIPAAVGYEFAKSLPPPDRDRFGTEGLLPRRSSIPPSPAF
jgi:hypothetical protein